MYHHTPNMDANELTISIKKKRKLDEIRILKMKQTNYGHQKKQFSLVHGRDSSSGASLPPLRRLPPQCCKRNGILKMEIVFFF